MFDLLYKVADVPFLQPYQSKIHELIEKAETQPNITIGALVAVVVVFLSIFWKLLLEKRDINLRRIQYNIPYN